MTAQHVDTLGAVLLSLAPGALWLHYLYRLDRTRPAPLGRVLLVFLAGALSAQGVLLTHAVLDPLVPFAARVPAEPVALLVFFVVVVGLLEELWKLLAVRLLAWRWIEQPADGLLFAGVSALGFATAENAVYILRFEDPTVLFSRWIMSTFGHVLMAMPWGYALGVTRAGPAGERGFALVLRGLAVAAFVHGLYDWLLAVGWPVLAVFLLLGSWKLFLARVRQAAAMSPFRRHVVRAVRECGSCRALVRRDAARCTACGARMGEGPAACPHCLATLREGSATCANCGVGIRKLLPETP